MFQPLGSTKMLKTKNKEKVMLLPDPQTDWSQMFMTDKVKTRIIEFKKKP